MCTSSERSDEENEKYMGAYTTCIIESEEDKVSPFVQMEVS